jgi:hypothetical protein
VTNKYVFYKRYCSGLQIGPIALKLEDKAGLHLIQGMLMKIMTFHPLAIVAEKFCSSASEIRRSWDTSPWNGMGD